MDRGEGGTPTEGKKQSMAQALKGDEADLGSTQKSGNPNSDETFDQFFNKELDLEISKLF